MMTTHGILPPEGMIPLAEAQEAPLEATTQEEAHPEEITRAEAHQEVGAEAHLAVAPLEEAHLAEVHLEVQTPTAMTTIRLGEEAADHQLNNPRVVFSGPTHSVKMTKSTSANAEAGTPPPPGPNLIKCPVHQHPSSTAGTSRLRVSSTPFTLTWVIKKPRKKTSSNICCSACRETP